MENKKIDPVILMAFCILVLFGGLVVTVCYYDVKLKYSQESYAAWCKLHKRNDFTYEEWRTARRSGLLDSPQSRSTTVVVPVPVRH